MMFIRLMQVELIKTKRSLALLMMFLSPLMVLLVNLLLLLNNEGKMIEEKGWSLYWMQNYAMWGYFMMPLYLALITTLLNGVEHRSNGWRFMMSLPIKQKDLFLVKLILAWIYLIGASLVLFTAIFISIILLESFGVNGKDIISFDVSQKLIFSCVSCVAIMTVQHIISWRWKSIVAPLGVGVVATMSIMQFSSSEYWRFNPWTYTLMTTNSPNADIQSAAILYSLLVSLILAFLAMFWLGKREVSC
ncbi:MAG: ABC transporter permease [Kangiellaceae bacterium]